MPGVAPWLLTTATALLGPAAMARDLSFDERVYYTHQIGGQVPVTGTVAGTLADVQTSDNSVQTITEVLSSGGSPPNRFSLLEHRWTFSLPAGASRQLHAEGGRSTSSDGDDFRFEWSTDGTSFTAISMPSLAGHDFDIVGALPGGAAGTLIIRVADTDRTPGHQTLDQVQIDEIFVRGISP